MLTDALDVAGEASQSYAVSYPRPGWAEQDACAWERALAPAISAALAAAGVSAGDVIAIGVAGQLDGCLAVDAAGAPLGPCLIWMDRRADAELPTLPDDFRLRTGLTADASHMAAKIRWLQRNTDTEAAWFHQPVSYVVSRLTGAHVLDRGLASTTMLYRLGGDDYDEALLDCFGIDRATLPAIAAAHEVAGELTAVGATLTGLREGTPVAVGTGDDFATPLGAGLVTPGTVACVLGTAEVVGALSAKPVVDDTGLVETHAYATEAFFIENPGWLSGGALTWLCTILGFDDAAELDQAAATTPAGAEDLLFIPALTGAMAPEWSSGARGCFYGFTPAHRRGHIARAVLEGCAFAMRDVVDRLTALNVASDAILLLGGGARSQLWAAIRADISGLPVDTADRADTCPVGAAMLAAVACGGQADVRSCADLVRGVRTRIQPEPSRAAGYQRSYERYRLLFERLKPLYS